MRYSKAFLIKQQDGLCSIIIHNYNSAIINLAAFSSPFYESCFSRHKPNHTQRLIILKEEGKKVSVIACMMIVFMCF